jgi:hypothetical protein
MKSAVKLSIRAFALAVCIAGTGVNSVEAGEPIIISNSKDRVEPGKENKAESGLFGKSLGRIQNTDPLQSISPTLLPTIHPHNARLDQRRQNEADEKANWLLLDKGDLTKDNEAFGVDDRRYSADGLEKEDKSRDYTFRTVNGGGKPGMKNGKPNAELLHQIQKTRKDAADLESSPLNNGAGGFQSTSDLNFQKMLDPGKSDRGFFGISKSDFGVKDIFSSPAPSMSDKVLETHSAKFNDFLNGPSLANSSDPFRSAGAGFGAGGSGLDFGPKGPAPSNPLFPAAAASPGIAGPSFAIPAADPNYGRANPYSSPTPANREPARSYTPAAAKEFPRRTF